MPQRPRYADITDLLEVVEEFVPHSGWVTPGEVKDSILAVVQPLMPALKANLPGRPYSPERVRGALELLATDPRSHVKRRLHRRHPHARLIVQFGKWVESE